MEAIAAGQRPHRTQRSHQMWLITSVSAVGAFVVSLVALIAGVGILYLIRGAPLGFGPGVHGALPLEQLAGRAAQPLSHMVIAWVPAGFAAGLALVSLTKLGKVARTILLTVLAAVTLLLAGALADSIAVNDPLSPHIAPQLTRAGTWIAVALFAGGSLCAGLIPRRGRPYPKVNA